MAPSPLTVPPGPAASSHEPDAAGALRRRVLELERLSSIDRLTGLWSRAHFDRVVGREIGSAEAQHSPLSLVLVAPERLEGAGMQGRGAIVRAMASRLTQMSRPTDLAFRWGAAELALLAPATSAPAMSSLATRLCRNLSQAEYPSIGPLAFCAGAAEHHAGEASEPWVARVTAALGAAQAIGGSRVIVAPGGASEIWADERHESVLRLVWSDELVSSHPLLDAQHGALFDAANRLLAALSDARPNAPGVLEQVDCLLAALARHFVDEESVLAEVGYPDLARHRRMHQRLLESARRLRGSLQGGTGTPGQVVEFLAYEVVNRHILREDRHYFPYVAAR